MPHILFLLIDDLGHAEVGWNRQEKTREVHTPNLDRLASDGIVLDRHYVHKFCSPTRTSIQSGRAPIHANVINASPEVSNPDDPIAGFAAMPRNMTGIAEVMKSAGYATHMVGKWDVGMATVDHTPAGRGYDTSLIYFHHSNDYWTFTAEKCGDTDVVDLWNMYGEVPFPGRPAKYHWNDEACTVNSQHPDNATCVYEDALFESRVTSIIERHDAKVPLFLFWSTHTVHGPLQPPEEEFAKFSFIDNEGRQKYHAMVSWIDGAVGRVVDKLKAKGLFENTLIVMSSDNGGPLPSGNNYPLKGGKFSNWEGGIRVAAFASGGFLPKAVRGSVQEGLITGWDWYATFAALAGADPADKKAAAAGLPPHDSFNQWPLLSGQNTTSPRRRLEIGSNVGGDDHGRKTGQTTVGGILVPPYKLLVGYGEGDSINMAGWPGPQSPNGTSVDFKGMKMSCGTTPDTGCLFNVFKDPEERQNLANDRPDVFRSMLAELLEVNATVFSPNRGTTNPAACETALGKYGGAWGPFLP